ncbi:MAG TPA: TetR family transcriptional regulator [Candidatus Lumbricidophila sp.]|nr:TetR family transcriptional regulator [Candidatus Lumbricidophila sp.]
MTELSLRERKKQQTRQAMHEAACELMAARGLGQVTIDEICAKADVSARTFFNYFPSKGAAVLGLPQPRVPDDARTRFEQHQGSLIDDLCELVAVIVASRGGATEIRGAIQRHPELMPAMKQWFTEVRAQVIDLAEARAESRRAQLAVAIVFAAATFQADHGVATPTANQLRSAVAELAAAAVSTE